MEMSRNHVMWHRHRLALDHQQSSAASKGSLLSLEVPSHSHLNYRPHIMSAETGSSILDGAIACIGERISAILLRPGDEDKNYITSLHNEVVSVIRCSKISVISFHLNLDIACCRVDRWSSLIWRQLSLCARLSQGRLPQFFGH